MHASSLRLRSALIFLSSFLLLISGLSYGAYEDTVRKTFEVGPGGKLTLEEEIKRPGWKPGVYVGIITVSFEERNGNCDHRGVTDRYLAGRRRRVATART